MVPAKATGIKRESGSGGGGGGGGGCAEQHFEYHRHIGPGDVLTAEVKPGKTWEKEGKRSGKLVFQKPLLNTATKMVSWLLRRVALVFEPNAQ